MIVNASLFFVHRKYSQSAEGLQTVPVPFWLKETVLQTLTCVTILLVIVEHKDQFPRILAFPEFVNASIKIPSFSLFDLL